MDCSICVFLGFSTGPRPEVWKCGVVGFRTDVEVPDCGQEGETRLPFQSKLSWHYPTSVKGTFVSLSFFSLNLGSIPKADEATTAVPILFLPCDIDKNFIIRQLQIFPALFRPTMVESIKSRVTKLPWLAAILTATCIILTFVFHRRWTRPISQWPINLPLRRYTFIDHPELRDFDDAAVNDRWAGMVWHEWWDTEWRDDTGHHFPQGIDVFHKMHCLVAIREEFATLATDETRATAVNARDPEAKGPKPNINTNHLQHCFDFLRQVCSQVVSIHYGIVLTVHWIFCARQT